MILAHTTGSPRFAIHRTGREVADGGLGITWSCRGRHVNGETGKVRKVVYLAKNLRPDNEPLCSHMLRWLKEACQDHFLSPYFDLTPSGKEAAPDCPCGPCYYSTPAAPPPPPDPEGNTRARHRAAKSRAHKARLRAQAAPRFGGKFAPASPVAKVRAQERIVKAQAEKLEREKRLLKALRAVRKKDDERRAKARKKAKK